MPSTDDDGPTGAKRPEQGHDMRAHLRPGMHPYLDGPGLAPAGDHPINLEQLRRRIREAKQRIGGEP